MRALFKALLKGSGTPVVQTVRNGEETILSAGNIWTSAHARRIALSDAGLARGGLVASAAGGLQAIVDFVACAIGGFAYFPLSPEGLAGLRGEVAARPVQAPAGTMLIGADGACAFHPGVLPTALGGPERLAGCQLVLARPGGAACFTGDALESGLAALAARLATPPGGTRLSACTHHHEIGFVVDTLLALTRRQTIYVRSPDPARPPAQWIAELLALGVEDLVMPPALLAALAAQARRAGAADTRPLAAIRAHTGGQPLTPADRQALEGAFGAVFAERLDACGVAPSPALRAQHLVPIF